MSKPFKSQFDLMAEAYGDIKYNKQAIINEYSATRKVRGYEPQVIGESHKHGAVEEHYPEDKDTRTAGEALNDARDDRDGDDAARERLNATNPAENAEVSVKAEVLAACKQRAVELAGPEAVTTNAGMAVGCESMYNEYGKDGDQVKAEIAFNQHHYFDEQAKGGFEKTPYKVEAAEDAEEAGFNHKQLDELEDIVHAILDKRDHEDRASKHEDGEY